ncbi:putative pentatricopeptide repeat-containing protein At1g03510 isoform X2 [Dendrobium catenatum]|uniref:putative pentatricopeptide repeat-containing protein At1g03510 isoform X2 n=1 Tax=Dendrobium catenatum TaxID=906689 RepID=UPI0009F3183D|nr:putative pentatricopeptide repeat-containing protein At1g03510 isoform X2 [Dendrobium catenatum]
MTTTLQSSHQKLVKLTKLLTSFVNNGHHHQALTLFSQMFAAPDLALDPFAFPLALKSSAALRLPSTVASLHTHSLKSGFLSNPFISSSLVDAYGKCASLTDARQVFDESSERNAVVWNAMISLYSHSNDITNALKLFELMDVPSTESSYNPIIAALSESEDSSVCLNVGSLSSIKEIHGYGFRCSIHRNAHLGSMLVEAYSRCGCLVYARNVFDELSDRDVVVWSSMVSAYAFHGHANNAMHVFREMESNAIRPDGIMFLAVLKACSHAGLADDALRYFEVITKVHGLEAGSDHYSCLVDVMSRAGRVCEAYEILMNMPVKATAKAWGALLGACRKYGEVKLAEIAARELFAIEPENSGNFMLLANTYAAAGRFEEAERLRRLMEERRVMRARGSSWVLSRDHMAYGAQC